MVEKLRSQEAAQHFARHFTEFTGQRHAPIYQDRRPALLQAGGHRNTFGGQRQVGLRVRSPKRSFGEKAAQHTACGIAVYLDVPAGGR